MSKSGKIKSKMCLSVASQGYLCRRCPSFYKKGSKHTYGNCGQILRCLVLDHAQHLLVHGRCSYLSLVVRMLLMSQADPVFTGADGGGTCSGSMCRFRDTGKHQDSSPQPRSLSTPLAMTWSYFNQGACSTHVSQ